MEPNIVGNNMKENKNIWKQIYINRLIEYGLNKKQATENYYAMHEIDYTINPVIAADDEISYMEGN